MQKHIFVTISWFSSFCCSEQNDQVKCKPLRQWLETSKLTLAHLQLSISASDALKPQLFNFAKIIQSVNPWIAAEHKIQFLRNEVTLIILITKLFCAGCMYMQFPIMSMRNECLALDVAFFFFAMCAYSENVSLCSLLLSVITFRTFTSSEVRCCRDQSAVYSWWLNIPIQMNGSPALPCPGAGSQCFPLPAIFNNSCQYQTVFAYTLEGKSRNNNQ